MYSTMVVYGTGRCIHRQQGVALSQLNERFRHKFQSIKRKRAPVLYCVVQRILRTAQFCTQHRVIALDLELLCSGRFRTVLRNHPSSNIWNVTKLYAEYGLHYSLFIRKCQALYKFRNYLILYSRTYTKSPVLL